MEPTSPPSPNPSQSPLSDQEAVLMRQRCFRLIREVTTRLGWRYKLWIPAAVALSSIFLLPPRLLQFFTEEIETLSEINAQRFLVLLAVFGGAIAVCLWITIFLTGILREWLRLTISNDLRRDSVKALSRTRIDKLDTANRGDWMMRLTGDLRNAEEFLTMSLPDQIQNLTMMVGAAILFWFHSGPIALIPIVAAIVLAFINLLVQRKMAGTLTEARVIEGEVFQTMIETFEGLRTIRSFGAERFTFERINFQLMNLFSAGMRIIRSMSSLMGLNEMSGQLVITAILTLVAYKISGDDLTVQDALVYPFYINVFLGSAKELVASAYDWNRFFIEGGRLASVLYDDKNHVQTSDSLFGPDFERKIPDVKSLAVTGLSISYGDAPPVIDGMDFTVHSGEIVAVMGPSGCGKSTFLESLAGLREANAGEYEVGLENRGSLRYPHAPSKLAAFVEQQPYLFVGSIRENITMGLEGVSDERIFEALAEVNLEHIIQKRNQGGLDEILADRGRNLSVGQQYRLALCRALVSGRPFLLLDEPFAALDEDSVDYVCEALNREKERGAGIVLVTHMLPDSLKPTRVITMS